MEEHQSLTPISQHVSPLVLVQTGVEIDQTEPMNNSLFSTFRAIMAELRNKKVH
jgi:hypothetical protein